MQRPKRIVCLVLSFTVLVISGCATSHQGQKRDYSVIRDDTEATAERLGQTVKDMNKRADELEKQAAEEAANEADQIEKQVDELLD